MFRAWRARRRPEQPPRIYARLVEQAREPAFYEGMGVEDTLEGRFDLLMLHVWLALRRLGEEGPNGQALAQEVVDLFFADMDESLRELGAGDVTVPKKVRRMAEAFYGRVKAYDAALPAGNDALAQALARNVWGEESRPGAALLAAYVRDALEVLDRVPSEALMRGELDFPRIVEAHPA